MEVLAILGELHFKCQEAPVGIQSAAERFTGLTRASSREEEVKCKVYV